MSLEIIFTEAAQKDSGKIKSAGLKEKTLELLTILKNDPYQNPPRYEKLVGDLSGYYSRRINIQHRLIYQIYDKEKVVKIIRMWSHYE